MSEAVYSVTWSREPMYEAGSLLFALSVRGSFFAFAMHRLGWCNVSLPTVHELRDRPREPIQPVPDFCNVFSSDISGVVWCGVPCRLVRF